ncbi:MAG: zinc-ribbon domain-containing protein [Armatimonadia bacterium]|nr:zinc-ribbon domain-containing protein [Armatimonadia bacterium]
MSSEGGLAVFCSNCGEKLPDDAEFCPGCGDPVEDAERSPKDEAGAGDEAAAPPPPPVTPDEEVAPEREKPAKRGANKGCLLGCGGLLVLLIAVVVVAMATRPSGDDARPQTTTTTETGGESDAELPFSEDGQAGTGETGAPQTEVSGFDPNTVDASLLPAFYGFLEALGEDDPHEMEKWFAPSLQEQWDASAYNPATDLEHVAFVFVSHSSADGVESFVISEVMNEKSTGRTGKTDWLIKFGRVDGEWRLLDIPRLNEQ